MASSTGGPTLSQRLEAIASLLRKTAHGKIDTRYREFIESNKVTVMMGSLPCDPIRLPFPQVSSSGRPEPAPPSEMRAMLGELLLRTSECTTYEDYNQVLDNYCDKHCWLQFLARTSDYELCEVKDTVWDLATPGGLTHLKKPVTVTLYGSRPFRDSDPRWWYNIDEALSDGDSDDSGR